uniref:Putative salivary kunitz domain protein n=1 Tax=Ixodes ricinus TaxID=34613 RepID=A0A0K8R5F2_IXORI
MKLLLIAVVICIHTSGVLTTAKVTCEPLYHGGRGGPGGANVKQKWSFNPHSNHCEPVMVRSRCPFSQNCFPTKDRCEENCDPETLALLKELGYVVIR